MHFGPEVRETEFGTHPWKMNHGQVPRTPGYPLKFSLPHTLEWIFVKAINASFVLIPG